MISYLYVDRKTGQVSLGEPESDGDWRVVGYVGNGQDGDPFGLQPSGVCRTCGERLKHVAGRQLLGCPHGHAQLQMHPDWNGAEQQYLFSTETVAPIPFAYSNRNRGAKCEPLRVLIPMTVAKVYSRTKLIMTDTWVPAATEPGQLQWKMPLPFDLECEKGDLSADITLGNTKAGLKPVSIRFDRPPQTPLPGAGENFGSLRVCVDIPMRLDWLER